MAGTSPAMTLEVGSLGRWYYIKERARAIGTGVLGPGPPPDEAAAAPESTFAARPPTLGSR